MGKIYYVVVANNEYESSEIIGGVFDEIEKARLKADELVRTRDYATIEPFYLNGESAGESEEVKMH